MTIAPIHDDLAIQDAADQLKISRPYLVKLLEGGCGQKLGLVVQRCPGSCGARRGYVGATAQEDDGEPFDQKMARLTATLSDQFAESHRLEAAIRQNMAGLRCPLKTPA